MSGPGRSGHGGVVPSKNEAQDYGLPLELDYSLSAKMTIDPVLNIDFTNIRIKARVVKAESMQ